MILRNLGRRAGGWPRALALCLAIVMPALAAAPVRAADERSQPLPRNWQLARRVRARLERVEVVQMLGAILQGSQMGPGDGWFGPSQTRYDRYWLAAHCDKNHDRQLTPEEFSGPRALFDRLDRDGDGVVTEEDLDWTNQSAYLRIVGVASRPFSMLDANSNGRVSREEWNAFFTRMAKGRDQITPEDLQRALVAPPQQRPKPGEPPPPGAGPPTMLTLLDGLAKGELGSWLEGPAVNDDAPLFVLDRQNGKDKVALGEFRGKKPVVLIFGSFT